MGVGSRAQGGGITWPDKQKGFRVQLEEIIVFGDEPQEEAQGVYWPPQTVS